MTESFPNWTAYHEWLINSDSKFSIYKLDEKDGADAVQRRAEGDHDERFQFLSQYVRCDVQTLRERFQHECLHSFSGHQRPES